MKNITRNVFMKRMGTCNAGLAGSVYMMESNNIFCANQSVKKTSFVFIFCDDLGCADLPVHGYRSVKAHGGWACQR